MHPLLHRILLLSTLLAAGTLLLAFLPEGPPWPAPSGATERLQPLVAPPLPPLPIRTHPAPDAREWLPHPGRLGTLGDPETLSRLARALDSGACPIAELHSLPNLLAHANEPAAQEAALVLQVRANGCRGTAAGAVHTPHAAYHLHELRPDLADWPPLARALPSIASTSRAPATPDTGPDEGSAAPSGSRSAADAMRLLIAAAHDEAERAVLRHLRREDRDREALILTERFLRSGRSALRADALIACTRLAPRQREADLSLQCVDCLLSLVDPSGPHACPWPAHDVATALPAHAPSLGDELAAAAVEIAAALLSEGQAGHAAALLRMPAVEATTSGSGFLRARLAIWRGRSAEALGLHTEARTHYRDARRSAPLSWYGGLADDALVALGDEPLRAAWAQAFLASERGFARTPATDGPLLLFGAGLENDAIALALHRLRRGEECMHLAALAVVLLHRRGALPQAQEIGHRHLQLPHRTLEELEELDGAVFRAMYPLAWVQGLADAGVPRDEWSWVLALMQRESGFRPDARSAVGALGLLQVMPRTGREYAAQGGLPRPFRVSHLLDPTESIRIGATVFRAYRTRFGGSSARALAAYSTGPGRVGGWDTEEGDELWVELIPYPVVRHYVRGVASAEFMYRARLASW